MPVLATTTAPGPSPVFNPYTNCAQPGCPNSILATLTQFPGGTGTGVANVVAVTELPPGVANIGTDGVLPYSTKDFGGSLHSSPSVVLGVTIAPISDYDPAGTTNIATMTLHPAAADFPGITGWPAPQHEDLIFDFDWFARYRQKEKMSTNKHKTKTKHKTTPLPFPTDQPFAWPAWAFPPNPNTFVTLPSPAPPPSPPSPPAAPPVPTAPAFTQPPAGPNGVPQFSPAHWSSWLWGSGSNAPNQIYSASMPGGSWVNGFPLPTFAAPSPQSPPFQFPTASMAGASWVNGFPLPNFPASTTSWVNGFPLPTFAAPSPPNPQSPQNPQGLQNGGWYFGDTPWSNGFPLASFPTPTAIAPTAPAGGAAPTSSSVVPTRDLTALGIPTYYNSPFSALKPTAPVDVWSFMNSAATLPTSICPDPAKCGATTTVDILLVSETTTTSGLSALLSTLPPAASLPGIVAAPATTLVPPTPTFSNVATVESAFYSALQSAQASFSTGPIAPVPTSSLDPGVASVLATFTGGGMPSVSISSVGLILQTPTFSTSVAAPSLAPVNTFLSESLGNKLTTAAQAVSTGISAFPSSIDVATSSIASGVSQLSSALSDASTALSAVQSVANDITTAPPVAASAVSAPAASVGSVASSAVGSILSGGLSGGAAGQLSVSATGTASIVAPVVSNAMGALTTGRVSLIARDAATDENGMTTTASVWHESELDARVGPYPTYTSSQIASILESKLESTPAVGIKMPDHIQPLSTGHAANAPEPSRTGLSAGSTGVAGIAAGGYQPNAPVHALEEPTYITGTQYFLLPTALVQARAEPEPEEPVSHPSVDEIWANKMEVLNRPNRRDEHYPALEARATCTPGLDCTADIPAALPRVGCNRGYNCPGYVIHSATTVASVEKPSATAGRVEERVPPADEVDAEDKKEKEQPMSHEEMDKKVIADYRAHQVDEVDEIHQVIEEVEEQQHQARDLEADYNAIVERMEAEGDDAENDDVNELSAEEEEVLARHESWEIDNTVKLTHPEHSSHLESRDYEDHDHEDHDNEEDRETEDEGSVVAEAPSVADVGPPAVGPSKRSNVIYDDDLFEFDSEYEDEENELARRDDPGYWANKYGYVTAKQRAKLREKAIKLMIENQAKLEKDRMEAEAKMTDDERRREAMWHDQEHKWQPQMDAAAGLDQYGQLRTSN